MNFFSYHERYTVPFLFWKMKIHFCDAVPAPIYFERQKMRVGTTTFALPGLKQVFILNGSVCGLRADGVLWEAPLHTGHSLQDIALAAIRLFPDISGAPWGDIQSFMASFTKTVTESREASRLEVTSPDAKAHDDRRASSQAVIGPLTPMSSQDKAASASERPTSVITIVPCLETEQSPTSASKPLSPSPSLFTSAPEASPPTSPPALMHLEEKDRGLRGAGRLSEEGSSMMGSSLIQDVEGKTASGHGRNKSSTSFGSDGEARGLRRLRSSKSVSTLLTRATQDAIPPTPSLVSSFVLPKIDRGRFWSAMFSPKETRVY